MSKILITGSSGYIGQHLVKMLVNSDYELYGLDIVKNDLNFKDFFHIDIRDKNLPEMEFDAVVHLAALVNVGDSVHRPWEYYSTNLIGTKNILENIKFKNFIFASTGAADKCESPYGVSKRAAEDIVKKFCDNKNFTIFRFYNVIGSDGITPTNPDGLFYNLLKSKDTGKFTIYGSDYNTKDGTCIRDYVHVNEICDSIRTALGKSSNNLENLGHGTGRSVKEIVEIFKKVNQVDFEVILGPRRPGDIEVSVLDSVSSYMKQIYSVEELLLYK